jgi:hypothetical protein
LQLFPRLTNATSSTGRRTGGSSISTTTTSTSTTTTCTIPIQTIIPPDTTMPKRHPPISPNPTQLHPIMHTHFDPLIIHHHIPRLRHTREEPHIRIQRRVEDQRRGRAVEGRECALEGFGAGCVTVEEAGAAGAEQLALYHWMRLI